MRRAQTELHLAGLPIQALDLVRQDRAADLQPDERPHVSLEAYFGLPIHLVMAADVEQDDLLVGNLKRQDDAIAVGDADRLEAFQLAARGGDTSGAAGTDLLSRSSQDCGQLRSQLRMLLHESFRRA